MTQNPFQPWKQNFNLPNQFYRKNDTDLTSTYNKALKNGDAGPSVSNISVMSHQFDLSNDSQSYQAPVTSSNGNAASQNDSDQQPSPKSSQSGTKFSIFSQLLNLNKINAFDNLLLNASVSLDDEDLNSDKRQGIRKLMEQAISDEAKLQIAFILEKISELRPAEKLLLYLKMPGGQSEVDPLKQSQNPLGSRSEISHTINWVRSHLEHDEKVSIPKQEVYEDYVSFCGKINIKPLSTADFGKVMKQVFPDIRPRRLGTRGHSRYCYAAMRKATKLQPPHLPDLSSRDETSTSNVESEENTWKVIKSWSESLLNAQFESADSLASHITKNHLKLSSSSTSKQMLHKKLMQREIRERKRINNQSLKKRRKKRRQSTTSPDTMQDLFDENIQIKQEKETDGSGSAVENNYSEDSSDVPMNLTSTEQSRRVQNEVIASTNISAILPQFEDESESVKNKLKQKITSSLPTPPQADSFEQDDNQYVLCKKVRQAQQLKLTANATSTVMSSQFQENVSAVSSSEVLHEMLMPTKIPSKRKQRKDVNAQIKKSKYAEKAALNDQATTSPLNQVEPNDLVVKKDDLKEDFILPRERFISICNMDRNALDTYLNANEENSQDLELLQYFGEDRNRNVDCVEEDLGPASTSVPLLENYQLFNETKNIEKNTDKISQLRSMLEEKYNSAVATHGANNESVIKNLLQKNCHQAQNDINNCEQMNPYGNGTNSYACSQQRHMAQQNNIPQHIRSFQNDCNGNDSEKFVPQSPNTRRKNFSFVPIPTQSTRAKNINLHPVFKGDVPTSPFVSPRATPVNRRINPLLNIRNPNMIETKSIPVLGVNNTAFCRPSHQFKMEPASAPQSPSMVQNYNYSPQTHQQNQFQFQPLNNNQGTNYNYPVESRSQSVPPHCTNNNMYNSYNNGYSSACSSMAPTPVPSDYQEFSDSNILDIFDSNQVQPSTIKMEANDDVMGMLDNEILNQSSDENQSIRQNFVNSRSVPNTPLPYHVNYNHMNSFCPVGKSVPTTPIGTNGNPFRYSPGPELQRTRDFLINGFNNNNNNVINNNTNKMSKDDDGSLSNDINEAYLDESLLNNL